jgi:hypothetical protein
VGAALDGTTYVQMHGGMPAADRRDAERRFTSGRARILLATDAASEGLNLHHTCRLVINLELPWTPLRLEQRVGRVDRIGQSRPVHAVHFAARGTAEERVLVRLLRREWHARASLDAIARVDPETIARIAIEHEPVPTCSPPPEIRGLTPDLRADAVAECRRLTSTRALATEYRANVERPIVTLVRRRPPAIVCAWTMSIVAADEAWLWQTVIGTAAPNDRRAAVTKPVDVRALLQSHHDAAAAAVHRMAASMVESFRCMMRVPVAQALTRERAIADRIIAQRATMAVALLQGGLFEHRDERRRARQSSMFDIALARCGARIDALSHAAAAGVDVPRLAFAVVFDR